SPANTQISDHTSDTSSRAASPAVCNLACAWNSRLPSERRIIGALVASLRFDRPDTKALQALDDLEWRSLLEYTDRMHVTLALASRHRDVVPEWVRERLDRNIADNAACLERDRKAYLEIASAFERAGIEVAILKGLSHDAPLRPQGDLDLFCTPETAARAQEIVIGLGYE